MNTTAAKQLSPEKLTEVLTKIHKGATGSLTMSQIQAVVEHFGGSITPLVVLQPINEVFNVTDESFARLSAYEVSSLPSNPKKGGVFITRLPKLPVGRSYDTVPGSRDPLKAFVSVSAVKVSLGGKTGLVEGSHNRYLLREISEGSSRVFDQPPSASDVMAWLKKEGDLKKLVDDELGGEHIPAAQRTRDNTGHCAVCLQNVKLKSDTLTIVSHGYTLLGNNGTPGERTQGMCPGTGYPPYELSDEGTKQRIKVLTRDEDLFERQLGSLDSTTVDARNIRADLKWVKSEITRMEGLVQKWKVRPLPVEGGPPFRFARMASRVAFRFLNP